MWSCLVPFIESRWRRPSTASGRLLGGLGWFVVAAVPAWGQPVVLDPNYRMVEFFRFNTVPGPGQGGVADVRVGPGTGSFGSDVFIADPGGFSDLFDGKVWRLADLNDDGDAQDASESVVITSAVRSPAAIDFGFGGDLYILDYRQSSSFRYVYKLTNAPAPVFSQHTTTTIFNPNSLRFHELAAGAEQILVTAAQTFTINGGTNDGRLYKVGATGGAPIVWSSGANITEGSPAGWWDPNFSTDVFEDNWVVVRNSSVNGGNGSLWAVKDANNDGDANDAGESRRLAANFANGLWSIRFDANGVGFVATSTQILRLEDKNGDHDFYDFLGNVFDTGENEAFITGLPSSSHVVDFGPNGEMYVSSTTVGAPNNIGIVYLVRPVDTDGDGVPDQTDPDDDGDGYSDAAEITAGSDPLDPDSTPEVCDGLDNDGDGHIDEGLPDFDDDGASDCFDDDDDNDGVPDVDELAAGSDPLNALSTPEICDGLDNDRNDGVDEGFSNSDGDGQADCVDDDDDNDGDGDGTDCQPLNAAVHHGAAEIPDNGIDDNCNGNGDEGGIVIPGLLEPYKAPPSAFQIGRTIPLRWQYATTQGAVVDSAGAMPLVNLWGPVACGATSGGEIVEVNDAGNSGYQYDPLTLTWQFNFKTTGMPVGCYDVQVTSPTLPASPLFPLQLR